MPTDHEVKEILKRLRREGWNERNGKGSHKVFKKENATVCVPTSRKELPPGTYHKIAKMAGWE